MEHYIVFDIGGTYIKYGLLTRAGEVLIDNRIKTPPTWDGMTQVFSEVMGKYRERIAGVAVSAPGRINVQTGEILLGGALPYLDGVNSKKHFKDQYDLPAAVVNDGKAAGQAELWQGNLQGVDYGAAITLGTGIGGAIVVDGKVIQGSSSLAGEFSFILPPDGALHKNLTRTNASLRLIRKIAQTIGLEDKTDGHTVFQVINRGDNEEVNQIFQDYCRRLAIFISNLQFTLDISHVVIGGGISNNPILVEEINRQYQTIYNDYPAFKNSFKPVVIKTCRFFNKANLLGALYQLLIELNKL